jgi:hypothetical protein
MTDLKSEVLQIRVDTELLQRYKKYASDEGLHVSIAIRRYMKHACDQHERYQARIIAQHERELNKK